MVKATKITLAIALQFLFLDAVQQLDIVGGARKLHSLARLVHDKMSSLTIDQFTTTYHHLMEWTGLPKVRC